MQLATGVTSSAPPPAPRIPGKEEFHETLRYFDKHLRLHCVALELGATVTAEQLLRAGYDEIILANGVTLRTPEIPGITHRKVIGYSDASFGTSLWAIPVRSVKDWAKPPAGSTGRSSYIAACTRGAAWTIWASTTPVCTCVWDSVSY